MVGSSERIKWGKIVGPDELEIELCTDGGYTCMAACWSMVVPNLTVKMVWHIVVLGK